MKNIPCAYGDNNDGIYKFKNYRYKRIGFLNIIYW